MEKVPNLIEIDNSSKNGIVLEIPQESNDNSICLDDESVFDLLERVLKYNESWINPGHVEGDNNHNVSVTLSYKDEDIDKLKLKLWKERNNYTAVALLPYNDNTLQQAPFEKIDKQKFNTMKEYMSNHIDLTEIVEHQETVNFVKQVACSGGSCEIIDFN